MTPSTSTLAWYGFGGAIGLSLSGWAFHTYFRVGYPRANPEIGSVSTGAGFEIFLAVLFVVGILVAFASFPTGVSHALNATEEP